MGFASLLLLGMVGASSNAASLPPLFFGFYHYATKTTYQHNSPSFERNLADSEIMAGNANVVPVSVMLSGCCEWHQDFSKTAVDRAVLNINNINAKSVGGAKKKVILFVAPEMFLTNEFATSSDFTYFKSQIKPFVESGVIVAFYAFDEFESHTFAALKTKEEKNANHISHRTQLETMNRALHREFGANLPILLVENSGLIHQAMIGMFDWDIPEGTSWIGMDCYDYTDGSFDNCNTHGIADYYGFIKSKLKPGQKLFLVPPTHIDQSQAQTPAAKAQASADLLTLFTHYVNFMNGDHASSGLHTEDFAGMLGWLYQDSTPAIGYISLSATDFQVPFDNQVLATVVTPNRLVKPQVSWKTTDPFYALGADSQLYRYTPEATLGESTTSGSVSDFEISPIGDIYIVQRGKINHYDNVAKKWIYDLAHGYTMTKIHRSSAGTLYAISSDTIARRYNSVTKLWDGITSSGVTAITSTVKEDIYILQYGQIKQYDNTKKVWGQPLGTSTYTGLAAASNGTMYAIQPDTRAARYNWSTHAWEGITSAGVTAISATSDSRMAIIQFGALKTYDPATKLWTERRTTLLAK